MNQDNQQSPPAAAAGEQPATKTKDEQLFSAVQRGDVAAVKAAIQAGAHTRYVFEKQEQNRVTCNVDAILRVPVLYVACSWQSEYSGDYGPSFRLKLHEGDSEKNKEIVELLLANGADPNECLRAWSVAGSDWDTCLIASFPSIEIATILLEHGADPNAPRGWRGEMNDETFPIEAAAGNRELIDLLPWRQAPRADLVMGIIVRRGSHQV